MTDYEYEFPLPQAGADVEEISMTDSTPPTPPRLRDIMKATCRVFDITHAELVGQQQRRALSTPRHIAMWIAAKDTRMSLPQIARYFNKRDHTTVLHARRTIERRRFDEPAVAEAIKRVRARLATSAIDAIQEMVV